MTYEDVTFARQAIHNPAEPRHFMRIKPLARRMRILFGAEVLAETVRAVRVLEVGRDLYDPTLYVPEADIWAPLQRNELSTHCPLKGDAVYFDLLDADGAIRQPKIAWSYPEPFDFAAELAGRIAFYPEFLSVEEAPL